MSDISVLGIFVADISFSGSKIPAVGETILGNKYAKNRNITHQPSVVRNGKVVKI